MAKVLKVGDTVTWRGCWGTALPIEVKVEGMEVTEQRRSKYGESVQAVSWDLVQQNYVLFDLDNGSWAYSDQIAPAGCDPKTWHKEY